MGSSPSVRLYSCVGLLNLPFAFVQDALGGHFAGGWERFSSGE
jgi:hypothetical protein